MNMTASCAEWRCGSSSAGTQASVCMCARRGGSLPTAKALARHQGLGALITKIAEPRQLKTQDVKGVLDDLVAFAYAAVKKNREVLIPGFAPLKLKHKPARKAITRGCSRKR